MTLICLPDTGSCEALSRAFGSGSYMDHQWKRFWYPQGTSPSLDDEGFLIDPDGRHGRILNPGALSYDQVAERPCLVLLGEPGIGKSHELKDIVKSRRQEPGRDRMIIDRDLGGYFTDSALLADLFGDSDFKTWAGSDQELELFLDSLDESRLHVDTVARLLGNHLARYAKHKERLRLRIACRIAAWPSTLEHRLREIWGTSEVGVYQLAPLRRVDTAMAASDSEADPEAFVDAVLRQEVGPFAAKPITLEMLLGIFSEAGDLPRSKSELYGRGCLDLCKESRERRESGGAGKFSPDERLAAATRIAAAAIFANRRTVWTGDDVQTAPEGAIAVGELLSGEERADNGTVEISRDLVLETVRHTGLFTSHVPDLVTWAHQTYAEYLAARYLCVNDFNDTQIHSLLTHPHDPQGRIVPQLHETAAWVSCSRDSVFEYILERDPEVLLLGDVAHAGDSQKRRLVAALLRGYEEGRLFLGWTVHPFRKLKHPNLGEQLLPYITDKSKEPEARLVAVYIAERAGMGSLVPELASAALDQEERYDIRVAAARTVAGLGDEREKAKLRPLALGQAGDDRGDSLRASGLRATWPKHLSAEELFGSLVEQTGAGSWTYTSFVKDLREDLRGQLSPEDLPAALCWVARTAGGHPQYGDLCEIRPEIMRYAWEELDAHPGLLGPFAEAARACLVKFENVFKTEQDQSYLDENPERRRRLLAQAVDAVVAAGTQRGRLWRFGMSGLLRSDDLIWILDRFPHTSPEARDVWAELVQHILPWDSAGDVSRLLQAAAEFPILFRKVRDLNPVQLDSGQAKQLQKEHHHQHRLNQRTRAYQNRARRRREECARRIDELVKEARSGSPDAWWKANLLMLRLFDGGPAPESAWDLTSSAFWKEADEGKRAEILDVAKSHLLAEHEWQTDWAGTNTVFRPAFAAYRSLRLIESLEPVFLCEIPDARWRELVPAVFGYPLYNGDESKEPHASLVRRAYELCPDDVVHWVAELIDRRTGGHWLHTAIHQLEDCLDDRLCQLLFEKAKDHSVELADHAVLLEFLLEHDFQPAMTHCLSLIPQARPKEGEDREEARQAAVLVVRYGRESEWPHIWQFVTADPVSGCSLLREIRNRPHARQSTLLSLLSDKDRAELYLWLERQLPREPSRDDDAASGVRQIDEIEDLKNEIINRLKERGAVAALRKLQEELPDQKLPAWVIAEAEEFRLRDTWRPPEPGEVIRLRQDPNRRLVENGRQLLAVVCESLERYQQELQGEGSLVEILWDNIGTQKQRNYRPKDEPHLNSAVSRHLRQDLSHRNIVVNREVQIRRRQRTDIHVTAFKRSPGGDSIDPITAIIEAKGCWNRNIQNAMERQLVRYLMNHQCPYGIYLVGWFVCDRWTGDHPCRSEAPRYNIDEEKRRRVDQASTLAERNADWGLDVRAFILDARLR